MVGRELTKVHQEFIYGTADEVATRLSNTRGEFTVVVGPVLPEQHESFDLTDGDIASAFQEAAERPGMSRRGAIALVARKIKKTQREVYAAIERSKTSGI